MINNKNLTLGSLLGFNKGHIPFSYLGFPIFNGKTLSDKIKIKFTNWKRSALSLY